MTYFMRSTIDAQKSLSREDTEPEIDMKKSNAGSA